MDYYARKELSNSALSNLDVSVQYFKDKIAHDDENKYSIMGNVIHTYILENKEFYNRYLIEPEVTPNSSNKKKYCALRANGMNMQEAYARCYSKPVEAAMNILEEEMTVYIEFLKTSYGKKAIPLYMYNSARNINTNIKRHEKANELMFDNNFLNNTEAYNEKEFFFQISGIPFKSKLDRLIIDYDKKVVTIIDLKTYSLKVNYANRIGIIRDKVQYRDIDRQLAVYKIAVKNALSKEFKKKSIENFEFKFYIVWTSTNFYNYIDVMELNTKTIEEGLDKLNILINKYKTYLEHEESDHDAYYYENNQILNYEQ